MRIQLFDRGSPQGKKLFDDLDNLCQRMQLDFASEYIQDMDRVISMGIQGKTILLIDNEVALVDKYPGPNELEKILNDYLD
ncbi:hypothetical protein A2574_03700 [Candidatus Shapirobacteria bacterium RIFOXYD1_FULL_38_32]|uniref:Thioredoxin-like fold domain-containing protein n=2 Tax=Candidatus Shapironibacteriota TaxID=1752721 RepID=A0A1F7SRK4_9BACT|nr:MAG: Small redox-active disulfide protein 2 [Candidatus Shapirobacteria bacterium GW2011_GWE1_38_92]OGL55706.1 MAG: hypothetical protein A2195_02315 [Candidatus Shapirobacteria bacterium RIFOXYA1_FULL_39_17]OGL55824.1 MAG: hypothetical protein A2367_02625 [Candidatus Shapirobacteria bacterium RIFOXYB1_FULL_38_38]OGL56141.1 MAG: hypothetical protein A2410_02825 [Candidatus Shapirobacteria bacterium RIFOXYC1_FULL_38_24]OGL58062.1 MAG: hypothetical protein A2574_03700 [Candidatus Shapirobacteri